ncbi:MAG TPA: bifunctional DedA family/phosphatase PAP2 family protein [Solirubrobacterales bacterium]|jgi:undecaprenyl-diphosphatase|nr:bifunctional DedA family/phosphatase PAP2 family protein [Solirubrobacterales bacterium]
MKLRFDRKWLLWGLVAVAVIGYFVFRDDLPEFNLEHIIEDLSKGLGAWTYLLVAVLAFLETGAFVGLVAPGEFTVLLGGAVAGQGDISLPLILGITWLAAFLGDTTSFVLGAKLGREFIVRHGPRVGITEPRLHQVEAYFDRHGGKTILIGRFIGLVRALAPFVAGTSKMRYRAFWPYSVLGTGLWATTFILIGYFASQSLDEVAAIVSRGLIWFGVFVGLVVGVVVLVRHLREPENRAKVVTEMERRRALRPVLALARRLRPQAAFLWQRLTPGGLGLELTTLLAVLAVSLFVLTSYWSVVAGDPGPTPGDKAVLEFCDDIRMDWLNDVAKVVSGFGSGWVVFPLAALAAVALAAGRRWNELAVLIAGVAVIAVMPDAIKAWTDRPRPPGGLQSVESSAFPSGHAAHATLYTWLAVTLAWRIRPALTWRTGLIVAGILVTALIGFSRVYLQVHWPSDVWAGWALGFAGFSAAAVVALIVVHIRDNLRRDDDASERTAQPAGARQ